MSAPPVVVVGAGVIGLSIAWRAAQRGLGVTVVDETPGRGSSWAAAGLLAPVTEVHPGEDALLALNRTAAERYPSFVAEVERDSGFPVAYRSCGILVVARDADERAELDELFELQASLGLPTERVSGAECRRLEPALTPRVRAGISVPGDHQVDNRALVEALVRACRARGVSFIARRATGISVSAGAVTAVTLSEGGSLAAEAVVLSAGCWTAGLEGVPQLPLRPVKGQLLHLRGPAEPPLLRRSVRGAGVHSVYLVPRADGRIAIGSTVEEQGFDTRVTAGAVLSLLHAAYEILPGLAELELTETAVGLRPGTPDNAPLLGPVGPEGLVAAAGHYRNGILLAPVTADAIVELLATGETPALIAPFSPGRFERAPAEALS